MDTKLHKVPLIYGNVYMDEEAWQKYCCASVVREKERGIYKQSLHFEYDEELFLNISEIII